MCQKMDLDVDIKTGIIIADKGFTCRYSQGNIVDITFIPKGISTKKINFLTEEPPKEEISIALKNL